MNLIPLYPATPRSCAASLRVRCIKCTAMETYADAVDKGWTYNTEGVQFQDISRSAIITFRLYCGECTAKVALNGESSCKRS